MIMQSVYAIRNAVHVDTLQLETLNIVQYYNSNRLLPCCQPDMLNLCLKTTQCYRFEKPEENISTSCLMTVTFSDCVDRTQECFEKNASLSLDAKTVSYIMDFQKTWTGISNIRLLEAQCGDDVCYLCEFVQKGDDGTENVLSAPGFFKFST